MVEQLTLNQLVEGSNPPGVIKNDMVDKPCRFDFNRSEFLLAHECILQLFVCANCYKRLNSTQRGWFRWLLFIFRFDPDFPYPHIIEFGWSKHQPNIELCKEGGFVELC